MTVITYMAHNFMISNLFAATVYSVPNNHIKYRYETIAAGHSIMTMGPGPSSCLLLESPCHCAVNATLMYQENIESYNILAKYFVLSKTY